VSEPFDWGDPESKLKSGSKFKTRSNHNTDTVQVAYEQSNGLPESNFKLSPFADMVLNSTDVAFRCKLNSHVKQEFYLRV
jgi:hypothetical protein